jgi:hypothetical protein
MIIEYSQIIHPILKSMGFLTFLCKKKKIAKEYLDFYFTEDDFLREIYLQLFNEAI